MGTIRNIFIGLLLLLSASLSAQEPLTNQTLIEMKNAGLSDAIIHAKINEGKVNFDTSVDAILELKKHNIADGTIELMIMRNAEVNEETEDAESELDYLFPSTIEERNDTLVINNRFVLAKGGELQVYLPFAGKDFISIAKKKSNAKLLGKIAGAVGTGAAAVGVGSNNLSILSGALDVARSANAIQWGADAISQIEDLPISSTAKKIAGKKLIIDDWQQTQEGFVLTAKLDKETYSVALSDAIILNEITLGPTE